MGRIKNVHGNQQVTIPFDELLDLGFPEGFAIVDLNKPVLELLGGSLKDVIPFRKAIIAVATRIAREKVKGLDKKMPSRATVALDGNDIVVTIGGWKNGVQLPDSKK